MAHIRLPEGLQGIRAAMAFRPETAKPLNELAEALLHAPNSLTAGERELIATYVSSQNDCYFCQTVHGCIAAAHLEGDEELVRSVKADFLGADISEKLKALLTIAGKVQKGGKQVTAADVEAARKLAFFAVSPSLPTGRQASRSVHQSIAPWRLRSQRRRTERSSLPCRFCCFTLYAIQCS